MKTETGGSRWSRFLFWTGLLNGLTLCGLVIGVFYNYQFVERHLWPLWLTWGCWLLLAIQGLFAVVVMVRRLLLRRWTLALVWLLWAGLGLGICAATALPIMVLSGAGASVGEPPPGSPE